MRRLAHALIVAGLLTALAGEILVILDREAAIVHQLVSGPGDSLIEVPRSLSLWSAVGIGTAISGAGVVLLVLRSLAARLGRRSIARNR